MDKKVTAMTTIITPQITPYRRQNGVTLPWRIPEMALLQKSLCNGLFVCMVVKSPFHWQVDFSVLTLTFSSCFQFSPASNKVVQSSILSVLSESCQHGFRATVRLEKLNFELLKSSEMSFLSQLPSQELRVELFAQKA